MVQTDETAMSPADGSSPRQSSWLAWLSAVGIAGLVAVGCFANDGAVVDDDYMDDPPPPGGCVTECPGPGSDGNPVGGPCTDSSECMEGAFCSAVFDGEVQSFLCQDQCVPLMDDDQWCADYSSCCTPGAICSSRGYCLVPGDTEGLDSGSSSGSDTESASGTAGTSDSGGRGTTDGSTDGSTAGTAGGTSTG